MIELLKETLKVLEETCVDCALEALAAAEETYSETFGQHHIKSAQRNVRRVSGIITRIKEELENPEKTHIVWIPNTGVMPACNLVLIKSIGGDPDVCSPSAYNWSLNNKYPVTEYAIIEE